MKKWNSQPKLRRFLPYILVTISFALLSLIFYYPLILGKDLIQSDIRQYKGMSRELVEYRAETGEETYWVDNAFGGMPTYQLGAKYPVDVLTPIHQIVRILPRPAHILFLYLFSSFIFLSVLKIPWRTALFGAIGFGFSTYLLIILQVGHNTKALALSYMPLVLAGLILIFQNKRIAGFLLTIFALALQIRANHYQMTYYMLMLVGIFIIYEAYWTFRQKKIKEFWKSLGVFCCAVLLALGFNATPLLATAEYSKYSIRGASELHFNPDGTPKEKTSGLDYDYITEYSYGIFESIGLIAPRVQGGASRENLGVDSNLYNFLVQQGVSRSNAVRFVENVPTYWGDQPIIEAPAYVGITVVFFAILAMFLVHNRIKYWLVTGIVFSLLLSWGKNLPWLTSFFIDYFPLYNKFRAVSSIQIILDFCLPVLACLGLQALLKTDRKDWKKVLRASAIPVIFVILILLSKPLLSFAGLMDGYIKEIYGTIVFQKIAEARRSIFTTDLLRALLYCIVLTSIATAYLFGKLKKNAVVTVVVTTLLIDLIGVSSRYIDRSQFVSPELTKTPFQITTADLAIRRDTSRYRVFEPQLRLTGARTAYFHNALGGYHGAKLGKFQELFDFYTVHQIKGILDMLNVKYIIHEDKEELKPLRNTEALGNAWFINSIQLVSDADSVLEKMKTMDFEIQAIAIKNAKSDRLPLSFEKDNSASIALIKAKPGKLSYEFKSKKQQFAVFSEIYYPKGWELTIDGQPAEIFNVNYILRGALIPAGNHIIEFEFNPPVVMLGTYLRWITLILFVLILGLLSYNFNLKRVRNWLS